MRLSLSEGWNHFISAVRYSFLEQEQKSKIKQQALDILEGFNIGGVFTKEENRFILKELKYTLISLSTQLPGEGNKIYKIAKAVLPKSTQAEIELDPQSIKSFLPKTVQEFINGKEEESRKKNADIFRQASVDIEKDGLPIIPSTISIKEKHPIKEDTIPESQLIIEENFKEKAGQFVKVIDNCTSCDDYVKLFDNIHTFILEKAITMHGEKDAVGADKLVPIAFALFYLMDDNRFLNAAAFINNTCSKAVDSMLSREQKTAYGLSNLVMSLYDVR
jgi:hypothetical protein